MGKADDVRETMIKVQKRNEIISRQDAFYERLHSLAPGIISRALLRSCPSFSKLSSSKNCLVERTFRKSILILGREILLIRLNDELEDRVKIVLQAVWAKVPPETQENWRTAASIFFGSHFSSVRIYENYVRDTLSSRLKAQLLQTPFEWNENIPELDLSDLTEHEDLILGPLKSFEAVKSRFLERTPQYSTLFAEFEERRIDKIAALFIEQKLVLVRRSGEDKSALIDDDVTLNDNSDSASDAGSQMSDKMSDEQFVSILDDDGLARILEKLFRMDYLCRRLNEIFPYSTHIDIDERNSNVHAMEYGVTQFYKNNKQCILRSSKLATVGVGETKAHGYGKIVEEVVASN
ncbi:hypothetical protein HDU82_006066 [Entophlyctis luteolus]|nr:hypothetical protein HDU82_006066 [Entophlyctis luteolus]